MPCSTCTTRSPAARLVTSEMKLSSLRLALRGRTSRSPRMSCSLMTATSSVSKPDSMPTTASMASLRGVACTVRQAVDAGEVEQLVVAQHAAHAVARAFAPQRDHHLLALRPATPAHGRRRTRNTLTELSARSGAKLRPCRAPASITVGACRRAPRMASAAPAPLPQAACSIRPRSDRAGPAATACRSHRRRDVPSPRAALRNNRRSA